MKTIPFVDLRAGIKNLRGAIEEEMAGVLDRCDFVAGEAVQKFEGEFAQFCQAKFATGVGSGLDAIHVALRSIDVNATDSVIVPANTFIATAQAVLLSGARLRLVDCDLETGAFDFAAIANAMDQSARVIIPVHMYGYLAPMLNLQQLATEASVHLIEDAAQAHGAQRDGNFAGTFGDVGCFSFYPGKNLGAFGDAGAIVTNNAEIAKRSAAIRNYGSSQKYVHEEQGLNSRLDTLQAAILRLKLKNLHITNEQRRRNANMYTERLQNIGDLQLPALCNDGSHVFHLYVVRTERRDDLKTFLHANGIETGTHYPVPLHLQPSLHFLGLKLGAFKNAEKRAKTMLSLPMYPELSTEQIDYVCAKVREYFSQ